ncbi:hypothetical protein Cni_G18698 [Canna indica]|uniref:TLDc domain-containing protein n=1 Tax=Canna indica TaxID=4628 RepID=A0AAQ3QGA8_9LILI|nr:hypothetical protein Cni_G18698 [Canna indica]
MLSWKERVAAKLSQLLADTPPSPHPLAEDYSPVSSEEPQAIFSQEVAFPEKPSFSSYFLSPLNSTSCAADASEPNLPTNLHSLTSANQNSLPRRWKAIFFAWKDGSSTCAEESGTRNELEEMPESSKENMDNFPDKFVDGSQGPDETSTPHDPNEYLSYLTEKSTFMSADLFEFFESCLPNIVKGCQWILVYSTWKHGISLQTLLRNSLGIPGPCLLIVGDMQGAVFGGLLDSPLKPTAKRKYQGTSQTFVFSTIYGEPRLFRATGANRFYYLCLNDQLAFGGGGNFALSLDDDLLHGTSGACETFGNLCLAHSAEFELKNVELWGFAHSSRYLD